MEILAQSEVSACESIKIYANHDRSPRARFSMCFIQLHFDFDYKLTALLSSLFQLGVVNCPNFFCIYFHYFFTGLSE